MKFLYFDCFAGSSGDMILGAFMDNLVPFEYLKDELQKINLKNYELKLSDTSRHHIAAKKFDVITKEKTTSRHLSDIEKLISESDHTDYIKQNSIEVFRLLGKAEAKIHNIALEKVHFHEVGAVDSIIDIVGAFICLDYLKPEIIYTSPLPISHGTFQAAHGVLPVPAPATLGILSNYPQRKINVNGELVTPTGASIIKHISQGPLPEGVDLEIEETGYGAGNKDFKEIPNLLRIWLGSISESKTVETLLQIETNIDDMNPEIYPFVMEKLLDIGVNDVWLQNIQMKKSRPGIKLSVLCTTEKMDEVKKILFTETSTIGIRYMPVKREILQRKNTTIDSSWGKIKVKQTEYAGKITLHPEYEECKRIALENNLPLLFVYNKINELTNK